MKNVLKRIFTLIVVASLGFYANAQTQNEVAEVFNQGMSQIETDPAAALETFKKAHLMAADLGEEGEEIKQNCEIQIPTMQYKVAYNLYKDKKIVEAIAAFEETVVVSEKYNSAEMKDKAKDIIPKLYNAVAGSYSKNDEFDKAIENYNKAIEADPNYVTAYLGMALVYRKMEDETKLAETLDKIKAFNNAKADEQANKIGYAFYVKQGAGLIGSKDYSNAEKMLVKATNYDDSNAVTYYQLAKAYNGLKDYDKAIEASNKAIELENGGVEKKAKLYYELALSYQAKGDNASACDAFKNAAYGAYKANAEYQIEHVLKCN